MHRKPVLIAIVLLTLFTLSTASITAAKADPTASWSPGITSYVPGVTVGTIANYSFHQTGLTINIVLTNVTAINGAVVTFSKTEYVGNVKDNTHSLTENVSSQQSIAYYYYVAANLGTDDPIASGSTLSINNTITGFAIAGTTRTAVHMNITFNGGANNINGYWDQSTGLMLKYQYRVNTGNPTYDFTANWTLTSFKLGQSGGFTISPTLLALLGGGAIVIIAIIVVLVRRK
jgi:hypothetical protein